jgi:hypothetical protein
MTTTFGPSGVSSSGVNVRPRTTGAPNSLKKPSETWPERTCSGNVPPV